MLPIFGYMFQDILNVFSTEGSIITGFFFSALVIILKWNIISYQMTKTILHRLKTKGLA